MLSSRACQQALDVNWTIQCNFLADAPLRENLACRSFATDGSCRCQPVTAHQPKAPQASSSTALRQSHPQVITMQICAVQERQVGLQPFKFDPSVTSISQLSSIFKQGCVMGPLIASERNPCSRWESFWSTGCKELHAGLENLIGTATAQVSVRALPAAGQHRQEATQ